MVAASAATAVGEALKVVAERVARAAGMPVAAEGGVPWAAAMRVEVVQAAAGRERELPGSSRHNCSQSDSSLCSLR